jgi:hypothetical protein
LFQVDGFISSPSAILERPDAIRLHPPIQRPNGIQVHSVPESAEESPSRMPGDSNFGHGGGKGEADVDHPQYGSLME